MQNASPATSVTATMTWKISSDQWPVVGPQPARRVPAEAGEEQARGGYRDDVQQVVRVTQRNEQEQVVQAHRHHDPEHGAVAQEAGHARLVELLGGQQPHVHQHAALALDAQVVGRHAVRCRRDPQHRRERIHHIAATASGGRRAGDSRHCPPAISWYTSHVVQQRVGDLQQPGVVRDAAIQHVETQPHGALDEPERDAARAAGAERVVGQLLDFDRASASPLSSTRYSNTGPIAGTLRRPAVRAVRRSRMPLHSSRPKRQAGSPVAFGESG